jgi:hypothetical protein
MTKSLKDIYESLNNNGKRSLIIIIIMIIYIAFFPPLLGWLFSIINPNFYKVNDSFYYQNCLEYSYLNCYMISFTFTSLTLIILVGLQVMRMFVYKYFNN